MLGRYEVHHAPRDEELNEGDQLVPESFYFNREMDLWGMPGRELDELMHFIDPDLGPIPDLGAIAPFPKHLLLYRHHFLKDFDPARGVGLKKLFASFPDLETVAIFIWGRDLKPDCEGLGRAIGLRDFNQFAIGELGASTAKPLSELIKAIWEEANEEMGVKLRIKILELVGEENWEVGEERRGADWFI